MKKKLNTKLILIILLIIFLIFKVLLLLNSQESIDGDRAVEGIMAKHIMEGKALPFFMYGSHYCGSCALVAYFAAIPFSIFGVSSLSFKLVGVLFSIFFIITTYYFCRRFFNKKVAIFTVLLLSIPPLQFSILNIKIPAYMFALTLNVLVITLFYMIIFEKKSSLKYFVYFGLLSGIAYWSLEYIVAVLVIIFIFWFSYDKKFFLRKNFFVFLSSFFVAWIPIILYNLKNNFANIKQFLAGTIIHKIACKYNIISSQVQFGDRVVDSCKIFLTTRKSTSISEFFGKVVPFIFGDSILSLIYYFIFIIAIIYLVYVNFHSIKKFLSSFISQKKLSVEEGKTIFLLLFVFVFILLYFLSGFSNDSTHLMPLFPFLIVLIALFISSLNQKKFYKLYLFILVVLVIISVFENTSFLFRADKERVDEIVAFLDEQDIEYVYASYDLKWKIIFKSKENVIASCEGLCPCPRRYPLYEELVKDKKAKAYIFRENVVLDQKFKNYLDKNKIAYKIETRNKANIYYSLDNEVKPYEAIEHCVDSDGKRVVV